MRTVAPKPRKKARSIDPAASWNVRIGAAGDRLEQEADRVAQRMVRSPSASGTQTFENLQASHRPRIGNEDAQHGSGGQPLDHATREFMESRFNHDFSAVRTHTDRGAADAALAFHSSAFTVSNDIYFAPHHFRPGTGDGNELLAHELSHVLQQRGGAELYGDRLSSVSAPYIARKTAPAWTKNEIQSIQRELIRLGLYILTPDGVLGQGTDSGLVEAFGGDEWRTLDAATVLTRLKAAKPAPAGKPGEHQFRYGEMFKDGLLDMMLGLGFDEGGNQWAGLTSFEDDLTSRAFKEDAPLAAQLYKKAGRPVEKSAFGHFFVREHALDYTPPAGPQREIDAVVRLVYSLNGSAGKDAAAAFEKGMVESDVAYYSGHGRYGSGPDFNRNFTVILKRVDGSVEGKYQGTADDEENLEKRLGAEGKAAGRDAWAQFLWRYDNKRLEVTGFNEGNVVLSTVAIHQSEFGGKLMYWNINRKDNAGTKAVTGSSGALASGAKAAPERKYRVLVFDGCRSLDYEKSIRATPGFSAKSADMLGSKRTLEWGDEGATLAAFLDHIIKMQSAEEIVKNMDSQQHETDAAGVRHLKPGAYRAFGIEDNPVTR